MSYLILAVCSCLILLVSCIYIHLVPMNLTCMYIHVCIGQYICVYMCMSVAGMVYICTSCMCDLVLFNICSPPPLPLLSLYCFFASLSPSSLYVSLCIVARLSTSRLSSPTASRVCSTTTSSSLSRPDYNCYYTTRESHIIFC